MIIQLSFSKFCEERSQETKSSSELLSPGSKDSNCGQVRGPRSFFYTTHFIPDRKGSFFSVSVSSVETRDCSGCLG